MKVFLSYSALDNKLAGRVKRGLEEYGLDVFLAHEDIQPSAEWVKRILAELETCHAFLPILTEDFYKSKWTDQETGIAFAKKRVIIPLKTKFNPYGFISQFQALKIKKKNIKHTCLEIVKAIALRPKVGILMKNAIIKKFGESDSYEEAAENTELLISFKRYTKVQVTKIVKYAIANNQIYCSYKVKGRLKNFIRQNKNDLDPELLKTFYEVIK